MANEVTDHIGTANTTIGAAVQEGLKKLDDIPKVGKSVLGTPAKIVDGVLLTDKVAKAPTEKGKFTEVYKWGTSTVSSGLGGASGGAMVGGRGGGERGSGDFKSELREGERRASQAIMPVREMECHGDLADKPVRRYSEIMDRQAQGRNTQRYVTLDVKT